MNTICKLWIFFIVVAVAGISYVSTGHAQTCPRNITLNVQPSGLITINSPNTISQIDFTPDPNARYRPTNYNAPIQLPAAINPWSQQAQFYLHAANAGQSVTVQMTVTDSCGPWPTLAGAGPAVFPTAGALATSTPTRTPVPTPTNIATPITPVVIPTSTPQTVLAMAFGPVNVLQGNKITIYWSGRSNPTTGDFLGITNLSGFLLTTPIYTSSCTSTQGVVAKKEGSCLVTIAGSFTAGQYFVKMYGNNNSNNLLSAANSQLKVASSGGALFGKGQVWGTDAQFENPAINLVGGYVGVYAFLSPGDPGYGIAGDSYHHVGVADFGLLGENFVEAGSNKTCSGGVPNFCSAFPYMSWMDNTGTIRQIVWNGFAGYPNMPLPLNNISAFRFAVYEVSATQWTADFCDLDEYCCPIWQKGIPCTGIKPTDIVPYSLRIRFPWIFGGSETSDVNTPSGVTSVADYAYCCEFAMTQWTNLPCWRYPWDTYDKIVLFTHITPCVTPGDWYVNSGWR